jgi:hypothetical protein
MTQAPAGRREVIRAQVRDPRVRHQSPAADDLYQQDNYGRTLLTSLMRAQLGVTLSILVPAAALLALYPLLAVLIPSLGQMHVLGIPLTLVILGGGIYPPIVGLGFWYVHRIEQVEQRFVDLLKDHD